MTLPSDPFPFGIISIEGNSGGRVYSNSVGNLNLLGASGISVSGDPNTNTITIDGSGGGDFTWNVIGPSTPPVSTQMAVNNGYISNAPSQQITLLMPTTAVPGDVIRVAGNAAGGWQVNLGTGQTIRFIELVASTTMSTSSGYGAIEIVCVVANTTFLVLTSAGNISFS